MRLKEIKLAGFKSFVDPTTVTLPGNRIAVVGPNGCGKSNIIDAVRWVMGESSARQLRGEALTDVIFNGSNSRQPTSLASIELVFDNQDGRVGGEFAAYAELAIRREVSRDAQSVYYLNGTRCRRRDIADVFLGTGFGPRSYSIIEQGMISGLVEAKPEELRTYLEEAAGITKYRERRRETQNRIRHTVENLERLTDIRDELGRQLAHLKRQARAAERYRELKQQERQRGAELHAIRLAGVDAELTRRTASAQGLEVDHTAALSERQALDTALERSRASHAELSDAVRDAQGGYYRCGAEVTSLEQAIGHNRERLRDLKQDLETLAARRQQIVAELEADAGRIAETTAGIDAGNRALATSEASDQAAAAELAAAEQSLQSRQQAWEDHSNRVSENASETRVRQTRVEHGEQVLARLRERAAKLDAEPAPRVEVGLDALARRIADLERRVAELVTAIDGNGRALAAARDQIAGRDRDLDEARAEAQNQRRELAALAAVQEAALGRDASATDATDQWIAQAGLRDAPRLGESLVVEEGWERAIETVLGGDVQALVVGDTAAFVEQLGGVASGRLALVEARAALTPSAALPALGDFVNGEIGSLLAGVFAAESLSTALEHRAGLACGQSIVTRDGLWLGVDWIRLDRGSDVSHGVIRRARELQERQTVVSRAEARLAQCAAAVADARRQGTALGEQRESLRARYAETSAELSGVKAEHDVRRVRMEAAEARARRNAEEQKEINAQLEAELDQLETSRARLAELANLAQALSAAGDELQSRRECDASELEDARRLAREAREAHNHLRLEHQGRQASLAAAETARERLLAQRRELEASAEKLRASIAELEAEAPARQTSLESKLAERQVFEGQLLELRQRMETVETEIRAATGKRAEAEQRAEQVRGQLEGARLERERLAANRDSLRAQLAETGIDLEQARAALPEDATEEQWSEALRSLASRIERLGPINLAAIDECQTQSERKAYLDSQHTDLETALNTLHGAIRRIDRATRVRFKETFNQVNEHLQNLFPKVFGGGRAYLELTGEDWLDTGVTLVAQPPGKRNSSIHLLSGGEKAMAAVALIFSIFQLNPSPVCLLDEVDAPLDDTNVERFADLIREMSRDIQFVVITHNKQTIEMADHLLGVTMQEAGVSRLVSVDVEQAARMAAAS